MKFSVGTGMKNTSVKLVKHLINKRDLKTADINNSLGKIYLETNRNFNFKDSQILIYEHDQNVGKLLNLVSF